MVSHWDENDVVAKEIFYNVSKHPKIVKAQLRMTFAHLFLGLISLHVHRASNLIIIPPATRHLRRTRASYMIFRRYPACPTRWENSRRPKY